MTDLSRPASAARAPDAPAGPPAFGCERYRPALTGHCRRIPADLRPTLLAAALLWGGRYLRDARVRALVGAAR